MHNDLFCVVLAIMVDEQQAAPNDADILRQANEGL
jgi:hypothetical protein